MSAGVIIIAAVTPGIFWLWFYLRGRSYQPNPRRLLVAAFVLGMVSTIPAGLIEYFLLPDEISEIDIAVGAAASSMFFVVGPVEEFSKFMAVRLSVVRSLHFDEPLDGLVFAAAASLGFATLENLFYAYQYGAEIMIVRGPISTLGHLVFGSFWGWALASRRLRPENKFVVPAGLVAAAVAHGLFNFALVTGFWWVSVLMVIAGGFWVSRLFKWGRKVSPFRLRRNVPKKLCPYCGYSFRSGAKFCERCGSGVARVASDITCARCAAVSRPDAKFCSSCGDRFVELA